MTVTTIKSRWGHVIWTGETDTILPALLDALKKGADLRGADLKDANLKAGCTGHSSGVRTYQRVTTVSRYNCNCGSPLLPTELDLCTCCDLERRERVQACLQLPLWQRLVRLFGGRA